MDNSCLQPFSKTSIFTFRNASSERKIFLENDASQNGFHFWNSRANGIGRNDVNKSRAEEYEDDGEQRPSHVLQDGVETAGGKGRIYELATM